MFCLRDWSLHRQGVDIFAAGIVFGNPKFFEGESITTSRFKKCEVEGEALVVTTHSGSHYEMKFEDSKQPKEEKFKELAKALGLSEQVAETCLTRQKEARAKLVERVDSLLKPHELFVQIAGYTALIAFYKDENNKTEEVRIDCHVGMFQDSILIQNWGQVDFRFFPKEFHRIEPYHWSDGLERIHFENVGENAVFQGSKETIELPTNSIMVIESTAYRGEGLFSPDCVNGKSAFSGK